MATKKPHRLQCEHCELAATEQENRLREALRAHRLELACVQGEPHYVIFHYSALLEMTRSVPTDLAVLATISGVSQMALERYGNLFLEVLWAYSAAAQSTGEPIG